MAAWPNTALVQPPIKRLPLHRRGHANGPFGGLIDRRSNVRPPEPAREHAAQHWRKNLRCSGRCLCRPAAVPASSPSARDAGHRLRQAYWSVSARSARSCRDVSPRAGPTRGLPQCYIITFGPCRTTIPTITRHHHGHAHSHGPATPHPAQAAPWSILRMTVTARLAAALAVSAGLWAVVLVAMR